MNPFTTKIAVLGFGIYLALLIGCERNVSSSYSTRAEAEADQLFERGWLPEIIPPSSKQISTQNNLDLNTSEGEFSFDPSELDAFVRQLERSPSNDAFGASAYSYEDSWTFWISPNGDRCKYRFSLRHPDQ